MADNRDALKQWFCREVLPLEPALMAFLRRHWRSSDDHADLRQDVYERLLTAARAQLPTHVGAYMFTVARNVLINRARRSRVISIDLVASLEGLAPDADWLTPHRHADAREQMRRVEQGIAQLPPRCREVIKLRKVEGLSSREVADRLGVGIDAVEQQTMLGMRALTDFMLGGLGRIKRGRPSGARRFRPEVDNG